MHIRAALAAVLLALSLCHAASAQVVEQPKHMLYLAIIIKHDVLSTAQWSLEGDKWLWLMMLWEWITALLRTIGVGW